MTHRSQRLAALLVLVLAGGCAATTPTTKPPSSAGAVPSSAEALPTTRPPSAATSAPTSAGLPPLADVPYFRGDAHRTMAMPGPGVSDRPELAWRRDLPHQPTTWPILVGGNLIIGTDDGSVSAIDARTSELRWTQHLPGVGQNIAGDGGKLVFLDDTGVGVLDPATGTPGWHVDLATSTSRPTVDDGQVYVGASDGTVRALDLQTGAQTWRWDGPSGIPVRADVILDGVVYVATNDGRLILVDRSSGQQICTFRTLATRVAVPLVANGTVYVSNVVMDGGAQTGQVAAIDGRTCEPRWKFLPPSGDQAMAGLVAGDIVYVATKSDGLYALRDLGDRFEQVWRQAGLPSLSQPPALVDGLLYSLSTNGPLAAVRPDDGSIAWTTPIDMESIGGPVLSGGELFVTGNGGGTTALLAFADRDVLASLPRAAEASPSPSASPASPQPFTVVKTFDAATTTVTMPLSMAAGPDGLLYVIDMKPSLVVLDPKTGKALRTWGRLGSADGEFDFRRADVENVGTGFVAVAGSEVIVSDSTNGRFQVFDLKGKLLRKFGRQGTGVGQFVTPGNVMPAADGSLYVGDWATPAALTKLGPSGDAIWRVGGTGGPSELSGTYRFGLLPDGRPVAFADRGGQALLLDPSTGSVTGKWGPADTGDSAEISTDAQGHVYLFQYVPQAMRVLDASGNELGRLDYEEAPPLPAGQYEMPWGSHFWPPPVFPGDGYGYSFGRAGLVRIKVNLP